MQIYEKIIKKIENKLNSTLKVYRPKIFSKMILFKYIKVNYSLPKLIFGTL